MNKFFIFLKTTLKGGVWFLFPLVVLIVVIGKAHEITIKIVAPLADLIPVHSILGVGLARVLAVVALVFFCFLAGLLSKTKMARKTVGWLESTFLTKLPGYDLLKRIGSSLIGIEDDGTHPVVLARIEDSWQIGYLMETLDNGLYAVFVPDAPIPWSGSLYFMTEDRFKRLDISMPGAQQCIRRLGHGAKELFGLKLM
jgi:uncharacterized membrane protein